MTQAPQTELHRHLDVSVRPKTLHELARAKHLVARSTSLAAFVDQVMLRRPLEDLAAVLETFALFQQVLDRPEILARVADEVIEDCWNEGTRQLELRFSPGFVCELSGLSWDDALGGFETGLARGLARFPRMRAGLICIASRNYGVESVARTVEFFLKHQPRFIGFDLAGPEEGYPCRLYESAFRKLRAARARITVHAGEASGPENVWEAIELLGAERIGHGIASARDPKLLRALAERKICLEMCPTSNWLTHAVPSLKQHPLPFVLRAGVPVCINTDDPGIFDVTVPGEIDICRNIMDLSSGELMECQAHANRATFLPRSAATNS